MLDDEPLHIRARRLLSDNLQTLMGYWRTRGGIGTGVQLEEVSGVSNSTISRYLNKQVSANLTDLSRIAAAYNLPIWQLLYPGLNPASPPVVQGPETNDETAEVLEAVVKLLSTKGGKDVVIAQGDKGAAASSAADRKVSSQGPPHPRKTAGR